QEAAETNFEPQSPSEDSGEATGHNNANVNVNDKIVPPAATLHMRDLKSKSATELVTMAESYGVQNASSLRKQDLIYSILKASMKQNVAVSSEGVLEVLPDGFGFLRSPDFNYLPGPDDVYVSPSQVRRFNLRTGDTVSGEIRHPKEGERYF